MFSFPRVKNELINKRISKHLTQIKMKKIKIALAALPLMAAACSDDNFGNFGTFETPGQAAVLNRSAIDSAENVSNPYDSAGRIYGELIETIYAGKIVPQTVAEAAVMVDSVVALHPEWGLSASDSLSLKGPVIIGLVSSTDPIGNALGASGMGALARNSLAGFGTSIVQMEDASYLDFYTMSAAYESGILGNAAYTDFERKSLLMGASIARYAIYTKKRKDKDWETSVSVAAGVSGNGDLSLAVRMAALAGICKSLGIGN